MICGRADHTVARVIHENANVITVVAGEAPALIVEHQTVLAAARFRLEPLGARIDDEIAPTQVERLFVRPDERGNFAAIRCGGAVDAIIQSPAEAVQHRLHVELIRPIRRVINREAGEHKLPQVGLAIAVQVLAKENVRRGGDVKPAVRPENARGPGKSDREASEPPQIHFALGCSWFCMACLPQVSRSQAH